MPRTHTPIGMLPKGAQTIPNYADGYMVNSLGVIPRRGWDQRTTVYIEECTTHGYEGIRKWAGEAPLRLLEVLFDLHGMAQMAMENDVTLAFAPDSTRFVAVKDYRQGRGTIDDDVTANVLDNLWKPYAPPKGESDLSAEVAGLLQIQHTALRHTNIFGMYGIEAVIRDGESGVSEIPDIDPLSLRYVQEENRRLLQQHNNKAKDGWKTLVPATVLVRSWWGDRKNPYGRARCGGFLSEGLSDVGRQRNVGDWMQAAAWPRLAFDFPFEEMAEWAAIHSEVLIGKGKDGGDLLPAEWAMSQMQTFAEKLATLKADDTILSPKGSKAQMLSAGAVSGVAEILKEQRLRICQSLNQLPNLMGITDGGTQAYAAVQWETQVKKLQTLQAFINDGLIAIANLHLRLMGIDMIARVEVKPIRAIDVEALANARATEIQNELTLVDRGFQSPEDASMRLTGTGVFDLTRVYGQQTAINPTPPTGTTA